MVLLLFSNHLDVDLRQFGLECVQKNDKQIPLHTPLFFESTMRPITSWNRLFRLFALTCSEKTLRSYAYDARRYIEYFETLGRDTLDATSDELVKYRQFRIEQGVSERTQARELTVVRQYYEFLVQMRMRSSVPWVKIGRSSPVSVSVSKYSLDIRALSVQQWTDFRDIGLGGLGACGAVDESFRGVNVQRDLAASELAITTGLRLQEWRTLLKIEIPRVSELNKTDDLEIESTAKGGRFRRVFLPVGTINQIELYDVTERKRQIRSAQSYLKREARKLAWVKSIEVNESKVKYVLNGRAYHRLVRQIPEEHRRVLVIDEGNVIEPLSLFLGRSGLPPSQRYWQQRFRDANVRVKGILREQNSLSHGVTPHDLRHTFAVVVLKGLYERAISIEKTGPGIGRGTITEHIVFNPLMTLQRLMGHASPETTMQYLRFVDDTSEIVEKAFESWVDPQYSYADNIADLIEIATRKVSQTYES